MNSSTTLQESLPERQLGKQLCREHGTSGEAEDSQFYCLGNPCGKDVSLHMSKIFLVHICAAGCSWDSISGQRAFGRHRPSLSLLGGAMSVLEAMM